MTPTTTATPTTRHDGWTPERQRIFLEVLAETGSVVQASDACTLSPRSAYNLRWRRDGAAFRLGWEAAILVARARLVDTLMERAIEGQEDVMVRDRDADIVTRHRHDNRLAMSMLSRLDRMADVDPASDSGTASAQIISQDFETFLTLIETGADSAAAAAFIAERKPLPKHDGDSDGAGDDGDNEQCELQHYHLARSGKPLWYSDIHDELRTNFPPPAGFDRANEDGEFGYEDYSRTLSADEYQAYLSQIELEIAPKRVSESIARDAFFGMSQRLKDEEDRLESQAGVPPLAPTPSPR
ncbi:MAG: hypothetical protein ABL918_05025 [Chakrabartia sp.]